MVTPARQQILQRTSATISWQAVDSTGETGVDPGVVTVTVTDAEGTVIVDAAATTGSGTAARSYGLSATNTANLDLLTATWSASGSTVGVTKHDIVGGFLFDIPELRVEEPSLADLSKYPTATLIRHRTEVEASFASWTGMSWVPRFSIVDVTPDAGSLSTGKLSIRSVRWYRTYPDASGYTWSPSETLVGTDSGAISGVYWSGRTVLGIEHGQDGPPADLKRVAMRYCRKLADRKTAGLSDRATSYTTPEGMTVNVGRIGTEWRPTGDEIVDEVLRRKPDIDHRDQISSGSTRSILVTHDGSFSRYAADTSFGYGYSAFGVG